jgi:hypothetical protein
VRSGRLILRQVQNPDIVSIGCFPARLGQGATDIEIQVLLERAAAWLGTSKAIDLSTRSKQLRITKMFISLMTAPCAAVRQIVSDLAKDGWQIVGMTSIPSGQRTTPAL